MEIVIKNIILYDSWQNVSGFAEIRVDRTVTAVKLRHTFSQRDLLLSVVADGQSAGVFPIKDVLETFEIRRTLDLAREVFICIMQRMGNTVSTLASGAINLRKENREQPIVSDYAERPPVVGFGQSAPLREIIDETAYAPIQRNAAPRSAPSAEENEQVLVRNRREHTDRNEAKKVMQDERDSAVTVAGLTSGEKPKFENVRAAAETTVRPALGESRAVAEIDEALRAVCSIDENGKGICESCPYRDYFYEFTLDHAECKNNSVRKGVGVS